MTKRRLQILLSAAFLIATLGLVVGLMRPALAAPQAAPAYQLPIYTPTPGPDGQIIYIVQPGDTLLRISLISGVPLDKLKGMNNLIGDNITAGQPLLLGLAGPPETRYTPGPTPTPTTFLPSPTPKPGNGIICLILFNDLNGDSIRQETETSIPEGALSLTNRLGNISETAKTKSGLDPQCFNDLPEGDYTVSVAVPDGYNPTTETNHALALKAGDTSYVDFGAQANSITLAEEPNSPQAVKTSFPWGIVALVFLLAGLVLGIFAFRSMRK